MNEYFFNGLMIGSALTAALFWCLKTVEWKSKGVHWSVSTKEGEEILQIKYIPYGKTSLSQSIDNEETVHRIVSQYFEEEWEDCKDVVDIKRR